MYSASLPKSYIQKEYFVSSSVNRIKIPSESKSIRNNDLLYSNQRKNAKTVSAVDAITNGTLLISILHLPLIYRATFHSTVICALVHVVNFSMKLVPKMKESKDLCFKCFNLIYDVLNTSSNLQHHKPHTKSLVIYSICLCIRLYGREFLRKNEFRLPQPAASNEIHSQPSVQANIKCSTETRKIIEKL